MQNAKADLRKALMAQRTALSPEDRAQASDAICSHVADFVAQRGLLQVCLFFPFRSEPDLTGLPALLSGVGLALPAVDVAGRGMRFLAWSPGDPLVASRYGILEPVPERAVVVTPGEETLVLVPALAVDREGARLGYGGGFYDRFLSTGAHGPVSMGVVFAPFLVPTLPREAHDQVVRWVVSEEGVEGRP